MRITKYGHSCLFVEEGEARILIDPGSYVFLDALPKPEDLPQCNVLLLTHEHPDHTYPEALKVILQKSRPTILTNIGVQKVVREHSIESDVLYRGEERVVRGVAIRAVACDHGLIAEHIPRPEHVGFLIAGKLFHPGDCVHPLEEVRAEILAVPVTAPWMAVREGLEFVKKLKPRVAIPIHDGFLKWPERPWYTIFETGLQNTDTEFVPLKIGEGRKF